MPKNYENYRQEYVTACKNNSIAFQNGSSVNKL
jgi:hypothetical protein